jgi:hypothetical protein
MIDIRYNTNFASGKSKFEWRVIKGDDEHLVNLVHIYCECKTTSRFIEGEGQKWHITAIGNDLQIVEDSGLKIAYIK